MKSLLLTLAVLACMSPDITHAQDKVKEHPERKDVAGIDGEDKEMLDAQEKALKTLKTFIEALQNRKEGNRYLLKVKITEKDEVEHVWLEPVKWNDPGLLGVLPADPVAIKKHKKGDVIAPLPADVSDWVILSSDGSKEGGFTMDVIEKRRTKEKEKSEQGGAGQPATRSESDSEGGDKPQPEAEGRSR